MVPELDYLKAIILYIDNKMRFAEQWFQLRNASPRNTEDKERKCLKAMSLLDA